MMVVAMMMRLVVMVRLVVAAPLVKQLTLLLLLLLHQLGQLTGRRTTVGGMGLVRSLLLHCILFRFRLQHLLFDAALGIQECACDPIVGRVRKSMRDRKSEAT